MLPILIVSVFMPTTPDRICRSQAVYLSVNHQTIKPARVVVGIVGMDSPPQECLDRFRSIVVAPVVYNIKRGKGSAGASRNAALELRNNGEIALMHDDDEYIHPKTIEFVIEAAERGIDVITFTYVYNWKGKGSPWCPGHTFRNVSRTRDVRTVSGSSNLQANISAHKPCERIHHAYPALVTPNSIKYVENPNPGEDGTYLGDSINQGMRVLHTCFPAVAYRSAAPSTIWSQKQCDCFGGYAVCSQY